MKQSKIDKICKAVDIYHGAVVKTAIHPGIIGGIVTALTVAMIVSQVATAITHQADSINNVDQHLQKMIDLVELQRSGGFGKWGGIFEDFEKNAKATRDSIQKVLQKPMNKHDTSQVESVEKFIEQAQGVLMSASAVSGALNEMQRFFDDNGNFNWGAAASKAGEFLHGSGFAFGFDWTRWQAFNTEIRAISESLSTLIKSLELQVIEAKKNAAAAAPNTTETPTENGFSGLANIKR